MIQSELLSKGIHTTAKDLIQALRECWQIYGGDISDNKDDSV
jgi:hypothetical protein